MKNIKQFLLFIAAMLTGAIITGCSNADENGIQCMGSCLA